MAKKSKEVTTEQTAATAAIDAVEKARALGRSILDYRQIKKEADDAIKEALLELEKLAKENPQWFQVEEDTVNTANLGACKLVWKQPAAIYKFHHKDLDTILDFASQYPKSIEFKLKTMTNIDLDEFGIEKLVPNRKLDVE